MVLKNSEIERIKAKYVEGTRIRLVSMSDTQAPPIGTEGTVIDVDDVGSILVNWDNGSKLNLIPGEDKFEIIR